VKASWRKFLERLAGGISEQAHVSLWLVRWVLLGVVVGAIGGLTSALLLTTLSWTTSTRNGHEWLLWCLPAAGLAVGCAYHYTGGRAAEGNNLVIDEIQEPNAGVPRRMAPLIYVSTTVTQLFGGSAGREGAGIQLAVSVNDGIARVLPLSLEQRRILMIAAMSAGFGAMFGVPLAGAVFGLEVQSIGRIRYEALIPSFAASLTGDLVVRGLGVTHESLPQLGDIHTSAWVLLRVALLGVVFGLVGAVFVVLTNELKKLSSRFLSWSPARPFVGGILIIGLTLVVGTRDYLGLSLPLAQSALDGQSTGGEVFVLKLLFTAVTLGFGFYGGEVTPLQVIGATLGAALAPVLGLPVALGAVVGYAAVFGGVANVPLACTILAVELFGRNALIPSGIACVVAYIFSSHHGIYESQRHTQASGLFQKSRQVPPDS
jgi:H+/Cl- antiporter ClcA